MKNEREIHPPSLLSALILSAPDGRWSASDNNGSWFATMNGVEAWIGAFGGDYIGYKQATKHDIARYDIVIANSNLSFLPDFVRLAESRPAHVRWVMLIEGGASDYLLLKPEVQRAFAVSDVVNCINHHSLPFFRELVHLSGSSARVECIGIPYPVQGVRQFAVPIETRLQSRPQSIMLCPLLLSRSNDYAVARRLGQEYPDLVYYGYERRLSRKWQNWREFWRQGSLNPNARLNHAAQLYNDSRLEIRAASNLEHFFIHNASAYFWLNLDPRFTWARYVLDAASLGVPIITTASTGHGETLFPETTLAHEYDIDRACELGRRLLDDKDFYRAVAEYAQERITDYGVEKSVQRLLAVLP